MKPRSLQSDVLALMIGAGIVPAREGIEVAGLEDPELAVGERILVFLESIPDEESPGVPIVVPSGFDRERYYRVILSSNYSKLVPDGDLWRDVRSSKVVSSQGHPTKGSTVTRVTARPRSRQCQHGDAALS